MTHNAFPYNQPNNPYSYKAPINLNHNQTPASKLHTLQIL